MLEWAADETVTDAYPFMLASGRDSFEFGSWQPPPLVVDWDLLVRALLARSARRRAHLGPSPRGFTTRWST